MLPEREFKTATAYLHYQMKIRYLLAAFLTLAPLAPALAQYAQPPPQISVSGSAEIKVAPDEVLISAGVETRDARLATATDQNDERVASALKFLRDAGVPDKYVQTDFINVEPDYGPGEQIEPRFYIARKSIQIKLTTMTNLEAVLTGLLNHGVNRIHNVDFRTTQLRKYRDQAREMATRAAREKADALAKELGVKCGKPCSVNANEGGGWWNWQQYGWGNRGYNNYSQNAVQNISGPPESGGETTLSIGQISVSASVNVSFLIE